MHEDVGRTPCLVSKYVCVNTKFVRCIDSTKLISNYLRINKEFSSRFQPHEAKVAIPTVVCGKALRIIGGGFLSIARSRIVVLTWPVVVPRIPSPPFCFAVAFGGACRPGVPLTVATPLRAFLEIVCEWFGIRSMAVIILRNQSVFAVCQSLERIDLGISTVTELTGE
jgi:hypothetical protein